MQPEIPAGMELLPTGSWQIPVGTTLQTILLGMLTDRRALLPHETGTLRVVAGVIRPRMMLRTTFSTESPALAELLRVGFLVASMLPGPIPAGISHMAEGS